MNGKFKNIRTGFNFSKPSFPVWRQNIFVQFSESQIKRTFPIIQYINIWYTLFCFFSNHGLVLSTIRFFAISTTSGETYSDDFVPFFYTIVLYIRFRLNKSDKVCQWFVTGRWFSLGTPDFFTNKTDRHDITDILLKMALNTITQTKPNVYKNIYDFVVLLLYWFIPLRNSYFRLDIELFYDQSSHISLFLWKLKSVHCIE